MVSLSLPDTDFAGQEGHFHIHHRVGRPVVAEPVARVEVDTASRLREEHFGIRRPEQAAVTVVGTAVRSAAGTAAAGTAAAAAGTAAAAAGTAAAVGTAAAADFAADTGKDIGHPPPVCWRMLCSMPVRHPPILKADPGELAGSDIVDPVGHQATVGRLAADWKPGETPVPKRSPAKQWLRGEPKGMRADKLIPVGRYPHPVLLPV